MIEKRIFFSQQKYKKDKLSEAGTLGYRPIDSQMDIKSKLLSDQGELLDNLARYRRFVSKSDYVTVTRPNVAFHVSVISQFLSASQISHRDVVI